MGRERKTQFCVMSYNRLMESKYTQKQLRIAIASEKILDRTLYYSLTQKEQKNLSFMKNQRLLLLDFDDGKLYYINQTKNLPFKNQVPPPKNEYAQVQSTTWVHAPNSNEIQFTFPFNKEKTVWKFVFETKELADEWIKMLEFQKYSQSVKERDLKSLNKAIFEMPAIEKEHANDIVKEPQRNIANDESRILNQMMGGSKPVRSDPLPQDSRFDRNRNKKWSDWNQRFYQERNVLTLYDFQQAALDSFYKTVVKDDHREDRIRNYVGENFNIKIANRYTLNAKKLKIQFRNYQFILQATSKKFIVGVPLACLIEFENLVALVKANFPEKVEAYAYDNTIKDQLHQLERYTRVKNRVLQFGSTILGLGRLYEQNSRIPLFYLDNLMEYLPVNMEFPQELTLIRPEYMLDNVDYFVFSGPQDKIGKTQLRQLRELGLHVTDGSKTFSSKFYLQSFPIVRITELKNLFHEQGLNLKFLPFVYSNCPNVHVKKYIYTSMTAKIVKDYIYETIVKLRMNDESISLAKVVEQTFSILLEGNNNKSNQLWKEISLIFKRKFNILLNHKDIIPGFFFNSILQLIPCRFDLTKLNKRKKIFEEMRILEPGFLTDLLPKLKSYYKFLPENIESLKFQAKQYIKSQDISKKILNELFNPRDKKYESFYRFGNNDQWMIDYLSLYFPPQNIASQGDDRINYLYDRINEEPPSFFTMNLTKSYLQWCNKKENTDEFKRVFEKAMEIADYWLQQIHPLRSDLFEILSDYFSILGINQDMIKYMKESLTICVKFWGNNSIQAGLKQYQLADRYLRAGKKKQSLDNFYKAKDNMELNKTKTNKHGLSLMKLASIYLSELDYEKALEFAQLSIKSFQDYQKKINSNGIYNEPYKIKSFEILARIYEICDRRTEYKDLALNCARKFNQTKNRDVFQQMMRICLASAIFKSNNDRCQSFLKLVQSIVGDGREMGNPQTSLQDLMRMSDDIIVMERFVFKYEQFERSLFQLNLKKRQLGEDSQEFISILKNLINVVGYEYIKGLIDEKISCSV